MNFDTIIVGAGSAGCVLAHRLSEDRDRKVLLLEAGGEADSSLVHCPGGSTTLWDTHLDWGFRTVPQKGLLDRRIGYPRGKAIGGTSIINMLVYIRGNRGRL